MYKNPVPVPLPLHLISMFDGRLFFAALLALVLLSVNCHAKIGSHHCNRPPSSCGNIRNISDPFRLKGDPKNCGDKRYELACENNRTVLYLFSGKYYVEAINYDNFTIRVVDVGIEKDNCSSLPLYSLTSENFSVGGGRSYLFWDYVATAVVMFMKCDNPVNSPLYIKSTTGSCVKGATASYSNSSVVKEGHYYSYVLVGDVTVSDVADLCTVEMLVMTSAPALLPTGGGENGGNFTFLDVHNALAYGFELRWYSSFFFSFGLCYPGWSSFYCA